MSKAQPGPNLLFPFVNPEFRRNLWLQMGPMRLIGAPVALGALFIIMMTQLPNDPYETLEFATTIAFFLIVGVGGCRRAANAIPNEMKLGTWDNQRMSGMSAISMAWAKLIGCTIFQWYAGIICLLFMMYARAQLGWSVDWQLTNLLTLVITALCGQMLAMSTALAFIRKNRFDKRFRVSFSHLVGLIFMMTTFKIIAPGAISADALPAVQGNADFKHLLDWHDLPINRSDFRHAALLFSLAMCSLGLIRMMQVELRYRVWPVVWPIFTVAAVIFAAGFSPTMEDIIYNPLIGMTLTVLALTYAALFLQPKDPVQIKYLLTSKAPKFKRLQQLPLWLFPLFGTMLIGGLLAWQMTGEYTILGLRTDPTLIDLPPQLDAVQISLRHLPGWLFPSLDSAAIVSAMEMVATSEANLLGLPPEQHSQLQLFITARDAGTLQVPTFKGPVVAAATFAVIAFVIRDILLVHLMAMRKGQWHSDWAGFFFLLGLYTILPGILRLAGFEHVTKYLMPFLAEEPAPMIISAAVQVSTMLALVIWRWRAVQPNHETAPPTISADQGPTDPANPPDDIPNSADQMHHAAE